MSDSLIEALLRSQRVIVPYEERSGAKQVSNLLLFKDGRPIAYEFRDHPDIYLGPIKIDKSPLSKEELEELIDRQNFLGENAVVSSANIIVSGVLIDGRYEPVIAGIDLIEANGRSLKMRRAGAAYPYALTLTVVEGGSVRLCQT